MAQNDLQKVIAFMRKNDGASQQKVSDGVDIPMSKVGPLMWAAEPEIDKSLRISNSGNDAAIAKRVVAARDNDGLRWERIAARLSHDGKTYSATDVKRMYDSVSGKDSTKSYSGRGRNFTGVTRKPATKATSGRKRGRPAKAEQAKATSGRAPSGNGRRRGAKRGTRKQRGAANPS